MATNAHPARLALGARVGLLLGSSNFGAVNE